MDALCDLAFTFVGVDSVELGVYERSVEKEKITELK
jgi:hypothetical protein